MSPTLIQLTEEEFDARFQLVVNHLNPHATWGHSDTGGCLFETYGPELDFVRQQDPSRVWTLIDGEDGDIYVVNGYHFVNRIGYLISAESVPPHTCIEVHIAMSNDGDAERLNGGCQ